MSPKLLHMPREQNLWDIEKKIPEGHSRKKVLYKVPNFPQPSQSRKFSTLVEDREQGQGRVVRERTKKYQLSALCVCPLMVGRGDRLVRVGARRLARAEQGRDSDMYCL
jgi:hypothetical protein